MILASGAATMILLLVTITYLPKFHLIAASLVRGLSMNIARFFHLYEYNEF